MKTFFDYLVICIVGVVVGAWALIGTTYVGFPGGGTLPQVTQTSKTPEIDMTFERASQKIPDDPEKPQGHFRETFKWLFQGSGVLDQIRYLEQANCSDHALRQYAVFIQRVDTSGFDRKSGRLILPEGQTMTRMQWRLLFKGMVPLHPLAYMKDELVPANFKHVMKAIPRKKGWTTCKFEMNRFQRFSFSGLNDLKR